MKKIIVVLSIFILGFTLTSCGDESNDVVFNAPATT